MLEEEGSVWTYPPRISPVWHQRAQTSSPLLSDIWQFVEFRNQCLFSFSSAASCMLIVRPASEHATVPTVQLILGFVYVGGTCLCRVFGQLENTHLEFLP